MCYPKPGPRCSGHAKKRVAKAQAAFDKNPTDENKIKLDKEKVDYLRTPEGIKQLRAKGKIQMADQKQRERNNLIAQYKAQSEDAKSELSVTPNGTHLYYKTGTTILHRTDGPAVEAPDGTKEWWRNGNLHRDPAEGPAVVRADGTHEYRQNNQLHREDGPAVIKANGDTQYYKHGKLHSYNGQPAQIHSGGVREWYKDGQLHRDPAEGPAWTNPEGDREYWVNGKKTNPVFKDPTEQAREDARTVADLHESSQGRGGYVAHYVTMKDGKEVNSYLSADDLRNTKDSKVRQRMVDVANVAESQSNNNGTVAHYIAMRNGREVEAKLTVADLRRMAYDRDDD